MKKQIIGAVFALALTAPLALSQETAAPATPAAADGSSATVIFFREKKFVGAAIRYKVRENGKELCKLANGTFCTVTVSAGKHEYLVHTEAKDALTLDAVAGQTYFVQGGISMGAFAGHPHLDAVDKSVFEGMKAKLKDNTGKDLGGPDDDKKD